MIHLTTTILVKGKTPEQIFEFIKHINKEKYLKWHSLDHKNYKWLYQTENGKGSIFFFDEVFGTLHLNWLWVLTRDHIPTFFKARAILPYPIYLILTFEKVREGTKVIHNVRVGFKFLGIEKFFDWITKTFILTKENQEALNKHATEEFKNLEHLA